MSSFPVAPTQPGTEENDAFAPADDDALVLVALKIPLKKRGFFSTVCRRTRRIVRQALGEELNLVDEQVEAFLDVMRGENVLITGGAGVGKSHLLKAIVKYLPSKGLAVTASTGSAAAVIGAATFHSTLSLGLGVAPTHSIIRNICENQWAFKRIREMNTLIIDEIGMLTGHLFDKAGLVVGGTRRSYGRNYNSMVSNAQLTCPFDTVQLVLCGDFLQLPPVGVEEDKWLFEAKCWKNLDIKTHLLTHVHRQQDVAFIKILQRMRTGICTADDHRFLLQNSAQVPHQGSLQLFATNLPADTYNGQKLAELQGRYHPFNSVDSSANASVTTTQLDGQLKNCPAPKRLVIKEGARVMCLKNISENLVNGSIGTVTKVTPHYNEDNILHHVNVEVEFDGQLGGESFTHRFSTHVPGEEPEKQNLFTITGQDQKKLCQRIQIPLKLAWAISIHKSQGMSLERLSIDFSRCFAEGQAYVALSRIKSLAGVYIRGLSLGHMKMVAKKPLAFYRKLNA